MPTIIAGFWLTFTTLSTPHPAIYPAYPEIRGPATYSGIFVLDRWGGGYLCDGPYIYATGPKERATLLPFVNRRVKVRATQVATSSLSSHRYLTTLTVLSAKREKEATTPAAPPATPASDAIGKQLPPLKIEASLTEAPNRKPQLSITVSNLGTEATEIDLRTLCPILLGARTKTATLDGLNSDVLLSQMGLAVAPGPRVRAQGRSGRGGEKYGWKLLGAESLKPRVSLAATAKQVFRIEFDLPDGEYQCHASYSFVLPRGAGRHSIMSAVQRFDVKNGRTHPIDP